MAAAGVCPRQAPAPCRSRPAWDGVLTTESDRPEDWISAGQALQRVLLSASICGVSAALHSQPLEVCELRGFIAEVLCEGAYPQIVVRLGSTGQISASVRRSVDEVLL